MRWPLDRGHSPVFPTGALAPTNAAYHSIQPPDSKLNRFLSTHMPHDFPDWFQRKYAFVNSSAMEQESKCLIPLPFRLSAEIFSG